MWLSVHGCHGGRVNAVVVAAVAPPHFLSFGLPFHDGFHGDALHAKYFKFDRVAAFFGPWDSFEGLFVDLCDVDDHPTGGGEFAGAEVAFEMFVFLVQEEVGFVVEGTVAVEAPNVGGFLAFA